MKYNKVLSTIVLSALLTTQIANAHTGPFGEGTGTSGPTGITAPATTSPFGEGTGRVRLSVEEKQSLLQYADNAYSALRSALEEASGLDFKDANRIYSEAIQRVVVQSFSQKARQELMMRYVLNQALEMTVGLPNASAQSFGGLLAGTVNEELMTIVLEDSIKIAMQLYADDRQAIQSESRALLPIMEVAIARLSLSQKWASSIIEQEVQFDFQKMALQHFLNTAVNSTNLLKNTFAEEIVRADDALNRFENRTGANQSLSDVMRGVRTLRKDISIIVRDTQYKNDRLTPELRSRKININ